MSPDPATRARADVNLVYGTAESSRPFREALSRWWHDHRSAWLADDCGPFDAFEAGFAAALTEPPALCVDAKDYDALAESNRILASQADEAEALRAALTEARAELAATRNLERMRTLLADARRERDEARRALEDAIFAAEWAMAKMDRGDGVLEYTGTIAEGDEAKRRLDRSRAALGRPAPDGEPR